MREDRAGVARRVLPLAAAHEAVDRVGGQQDLHHRDDEVRPGDALEDARNPHVRHVDPLAAEPDVGALRQAAEHEELERAAEDLVQQARPRVLLHREGHRDTHHAVQQRL